jgi:hypothetical protein
MSANDYPNAKIHLKLEIKSTAVNPQGVINLYFISAIETPTSTKSWSDGIDPASTADLAGTLYNVRPLKTLNAGSTNKSVIYWNCNDLSRVRDVGGDQVGDLPPYWSLLVENHSGAVFGATQVAQFSKVSYQG